MSNITFKQLLIFMAFSVLISCNIETGLDSNIVSNNGLEATFSSIEKNIFRTRCAFSGCHASGTQSAGLDLSTANAYNNLVNIPAVLSVQGLKRVQPFNSEASFLIKVLDGSNPTMMPLNGTPLDDTTIDVIKQWINEGANNN